jgi:transcriptional regulator with XRE-family HTH domain
MDQASEEGKGEAMTAPELRALRQSLGLTQVQLASRLGISERHLRKKESGSVNISRTDELALCQVAQEVKQQTEN